MARRLGVQMTKCLRNAGAQLRPVNRCGERFEQHENIQWRQASTQTTERFAKEAFQLIATSRLFGNTFADRKT